MGETPSKNRQQGPDTKQRNVRILLLILAITAFALFAIPNAKASDNLAMVQVFEPDESALFPVIANMAQPKGDFVTFVKQFIVYERYNKGFPFYAPSALLLVLLRWMGLGKNPPLTFLALRQVISVLPMLCGLLLLVWLQDRFRTYRSVLLFLFLLITPAVVQNGFWWHPDGLTVLLSALVLFFLFKDQLSFGKYFYWAAAACGVLTAAKTVGVFFFLTVAAVLILGLIEKRITAGKAVLSGLKFITVMGAAFLVSSPFLFSEWGRAGYLNMMRAQMSSLSSGYGVIYAKGITAAWPMMKEYFGGVLFLLTSLGICLYSIAANKARLLCVLVLTWFIPLTLYVTFFSHFKYQYWLPVALPLFSCWVIVFPEKIRGFKLKDWRGAVRAGLMLLFLSQFLAFALQSQRMFSARVHRAENNPYIQFSDTAAKYLAPLEGVPLRVYSDYRLYVPETPGWELSTAYVPLSYAQIEEGGFEILLLAGQRVRDYLNPEAEGVDPVLFAESQRFYRDVERRAVNGFSFLGGDEAGLIFILQELCGQYFPEAPCN
jgi:hypothetical protein